MKLKQCSQCGKWLPLPEFGKRPDSADGLKSRCKACARAYNKRYYAEHGEEILAHQKLYRDGRKAEKAAYDKLYRARHKEKIAAYDKRYYAEHKEEKAAYDKLYNAEHRKKCREKNAAYVRAWRARHPLREAAIGRRRRARRNGAEGQHTAEEFEALCVGAAWQCLRCGMPHSERPLTIDHIVPLSRGGTDGTENIQPLCRNCNSRKSVQTIDYWQDPWWACCT